jgi:hypothetical protein
MMIVILPSKIYRLIFERRLPMRKLIQTLVSKMTLMLLRVIDFLSDSFYFARYRF